jgi:DNA polymerase elongation subunit (family B)
MQMKRESLVDRAIWTAKKRYILNIYNEEGVTYKKPKIKIVGLEAIKSSTPYVCRNKIREAIKVILDKDENAMIEFIDKFRKEFHKLPVEEVAFPRSVNGVEDYADDNNMFKKGAPIHVKGAILYNHILKEKNLTKQYQLIKSGEKIKFCYLKEPNPYHNNAIAFIYNLPKEVDMQEYIDYDKQFDKTFLEPLRTILNCIHWHTEKVSSLEAFFA